MTGLKSFKSTCLFAPILAVGWAIFASHAVKADDEGALEFSSWKCSKQSGDKWLISEVVTLEGAKYRFNFQKGYGYDFATIVINSATGGIETLAPLFGPGAQPGDTAKVEFCKSDEASTCFQSGHLYLEEHQRYEYPLVQNYTTEDIYETRHINIERLDGKMIVAKLKLDAAETQIKACS